MENANVVWLLQSGSLKSYVFKQRRRNHPLPVLSDYVTQEKIIEFTSQFARV